MWGSVRRAVALAGVAAAFAFSASPGVAVVRISDPLIARANALADRVHYSHNSEEGVFGPPEPGYCTTIRQARATMGELFAAYSNARAAGNIALANAYRRAANDLGDELDEEDYLDWKYGPKDWCSPTAWDSGPYIGPTSYGGLSIQPTFEFGWGGFRPDNAITTTLPSSAGGSGSATNSFVGIDLRAKIPVTNMASLIFGGNYRDYSGGEVALRFDLDAFSAGLDTDVKLKRESSTTVYGGVSVKIPTISAWRNGIAGQPGSGTFDATLWGGWRRDQFDGSFMTNEAGIIRQTPISTHSDGYSIGVDVDYPLWLSGFDSLWNRNMKPVVRAGVQYDSFGGIDVRHQAVFATYTDRIQPRGVVTGKLGVGVQFYPGLGSDFVR